MLKVKARATQQSRDIVQTVSGALAKRSVGELDARRTLQSSLTLKEIEGLYFNRLVSILDFGAGALGNVGGDPTLVRCGGSLNLLGRLDDRPGAEREEIDATESLWKRKLLSRTRDLNAS